MQQPEVIQAKISDFEIRPLPDSEQISFTYLPTGKVALLTVEEAIDLAEQLWVQIQRQGGI